MPDVTTVTDITRDSISFPKQTESFRVQPGAAYAPGTVVQLVSLDNQVYPDMRTVQPVPAGAAALLCMGVISEDTAGVNALGFGGTGGTTASGSLSTQALNRFVQQIKATIYGFHPGVLVDQAGAGAIALTNGIVLQSSARTAGRAQGVTAPVASAVVGNAMLPSTGIGSSLTAAAQVQATATTTVGGVPAAGDTISVTFQVPYNQNLPGTAQTRTVTATLTAGQAATTTTAATALAAALNADSVYSKYYTASSAAAVVTHTANATALFPLTFANSQTGGVPFNANTAVVALSGSAANGATFTAAATGGSTATQSGNLAGGTGYFGPVPAWISIY